MQLRIFVIDDEECIRDTFRWHLEELGHEVVTAATPRVCDAYRNHDCQRELPCGDMLIIDYNLPKMNGLDFVEKMRRHGCIGMLHKVMLLSGSPTEIDMGRAERLGCDVREKPLRLHELEAWVEESARDIPADRLLIDMAAINDWLEQ